MNRYQIASWGRADKVLRNESVRSWFYSISQYSTVIRVILVNVPIGFIVFGLVLGIIEQYFHIAPHYIGVLLINWLLLIVLTGFLKRLLFSVSSRLREELIYKYVLKYDDLIFDQAYADIAAKSVFGRHGRSQSTKNALVGPKSAYFEYVTTVYDYFKGFRWRGHVTHLAVAVAVLPRELPHVLFDSKYMRGRQFRFLLKKSQTHQLQGEFGEVFTTYMPGGYHIDGLSFITPEVMEVILRGRDYDIEIIGNKVLLFSPLRDPIPQMVSMMSLASDIAKVLENNITTYRDERVPHGRGRVEIAKAGQSLAGISIWAVAAVALALWLVIQLLLASQR